MIAGKPTQRFRDVKGEKRGLLVFDRRRHRDPIPYTVVPLTCLFCGEEGLKTITAEMVIATAAARVVDVDAKGILVLDPIPPTIQPLTCGQCLVTVYQPRP